MRYFKLTIFTFILFLLFTACTDDDAKEGISGGFSLSLNIPGATLSRAVSPDAGESKITNVYLLFYAEDATDDEPPAFFYKESGLTGNVAWSHTFAERDLGKLTVGTAYDVYVLASLPDETVRPTAVSTKADLLAMQEKQFERTADNPCLSFTGQATHTYTAAPGEALPIELTRTVARMDITIEMPLPASISLANASLYTYYQPGLGSVADGGRSAQLMTQTGEKTYRCYLYENADDDEAIRADVTVDHQIYQIEIKPDGKNTIVRNWVYNVQLAIQGGKMVVVSGAGIPWDKVVPDDFTPEVLPLQPNANAYIVAPGGTPLLIPVAQANDANALNSTVPAIGADETLTAELVWTDVRGNVSGKGIAPDASIANLQVFGQGDQAALLVVPGSQPGNSVVAVRGADGTVKWSWHIWVTDYDPETEDGQKTYNGYVFMDRNLGAMSAEVSVNNANGVIGTYYQWGRKDPFPSKSWGTNALTFTPVYKADGTAVNISGANYANMGATVRQPFVVCTGNGTYLDANVATAVETWGQSGGKTAFDPCPPGWRVPEKDAYFDMSTAFIPLTANVGYQGTHVGFYPLSWNIKYADATVHANPAYAFGWTANAANRTTANDYQHTGQTMSAATNQPSFGFTVRCVRDWTEGKRKNEVRVLTVGAYPFSSGHPLDAVTRTQTIYYILPMTSVNFGPGEPVNAIFKYYSLGSITNNTVATLEQKDIDVLYVGQGVALTAAQAQAIKDWVAASQHHVLIYALDDVKGNLTISQAYGLSHSLLSAQNHVLVNNVANPANQTIVNGPYGQITNNSFLYINEYGFIKKADADAKGIVPLLTNVTNGNYTLSYQPDWRVVFLGDQAWFRQDTGENPTNGSLTPMGKGQYPLLIANLWAWIAQTALTGR